MADPGLTAGSELLARAAAAAGSGGGAPGVTVEEVTQRHDGDTVEARSTSARIKTVSDLLEHIQADLSRYEVAASEATCWEGLTADRATGRPIVTTLHRVWVRLRPKAGPTVQECVEAMIAAAAGKVRAAPAKAGRRPPDEGRWAVLVIADPHFGKYAWRKTAGADYDLDIASQLVTEASGELLAIAADARPERLTVATLGDLFHYDTPGGTTTKGTPLDRDGRLQKMIGTATDTMLSVVERAGSIAPTDTLVVHGNHDETLTWAYHRILQERFRNDARVRVEADFTPRKYVSHGGNLIGFTHGNKAKKKLPGLMAIEAAASWGRCPYREWHCGHLHHQAAEWSRPIDTIDGVLVRIAPAICPPDDYHAAEGYVGSRQAMELFLYDHRGGLAAMHVAGPRLT